MALTGRRGGFIALAVICVIAFFILTPPVDTGRFKQIVPETPDITTDHKDDAAPAAASGAKPQHDEPYVPHDLEDSKPSTHPVDQSNEKPKPKPKPDDQSDGSHIPDDLEEQGQRLESPTEEEEEEEQSKPADPKAPSSSTSPAPSGKTHDAATSRLHFLVPASHANLQLCYNLVSAAANRYPVPLLVGFHGKGLFSAKETHLAKLRGIEAYLDSLPAAEDEDVVVIVDGYDIIMQLPPEVMLARYFDIRAAADKTMAARLGLTVDEAHELGFRNTIFWGPDKICWPIDWNEPRCWAVPPSSLPDKAFGPKSGNGEMYYNDPRWLNSGTVIGPAGDLRAYVHDAMAEINATYDKGFYAKESDQYYLANIWGRQEYYRSLAASKDGKVAGQKDDRRAPKLREKGQQTEFHISIEYESSLFQTKAGYEPFFGYRQFSKPGFATAMDVDMFDEGSAFEPYDIQMPANVQRALSRIYNDSIPEDHPKHEDTDTWLAAVKLGTNYVTKHIYALWHCTAAKDPIDGEYPQLWFYPYASALLKAGVAAFQASSALLGGAAAEEEIDGRKWVAKTVYPDKATLKDELGGAWSDEEEGGKFVGFREMCGDYYDVLFYGDEAWKEAE